MRLIFTFEDKIKAIIKQTKEELEKDFDQSYDGGTAFFHNQMEKAPDSYVSAFPNRLVLYHGGRFHANCFDYTMEERITLSFFFKLKEK